MSRTALKRKFAGLKYLSSIILFYLKCSVKMTKNIVWNCNKKSQVLLWNYKCFTHFALSSYRLASETKAFFCDKNFCIWQTNSLTETFFLWQNFFFCDQNRFFWQKLGQKLVSVRQTCLLKEIYFMTIVRVINFFSSLTYIFVW